MIETAGAQVRQNRSIFAASRRIVGPGMDERDTEALAASARRNRLHLLLNLRSQPLRNLRRPGRDEQHSFAIY
jgi:hypothetical protein